MGYGAAISITLVAALVAATTTALIQRFVEIDIRRRHHEVGSVVFLQLGVVFAVLLAFVFDEAWTQYNEAAQAIDLEVASIHAVAMIADTLPSPQARQILTAEQAYIESVVSREWPSMAEHRTEDIDTEHKFLVLLQTAANLRVTGDDQQKKEQILSLLTQGHAQRETRIFQAGSGIPLPLWVVLIIFTAALALFVALSQIQYRTTAMTIAALFAAAIASILVLARLLDFPFEGAIALQPTDFVTVSGKVARLLAATPS